LPNNPGGIIYVDEGIYTEEVTLKSNVTIEGSGPSTTIKLLPGHTEDAQILYANGKTNITIKNLFLDGDLDNQSPGATYTHSGILLVGCDKIVLQNVQGKNLGGTKCHGYVAALTECTNFTIENVYGENVDNVIACNSSSHGTVKNIQGKDWCAIDPYAGIVWVGAFTADAGDVIVEGVRGVQDVMTGKGIGLHLTADNGFKLAGVVFSNIYIENAQDGVTLGVDSSGGAPNPASEIHDVEGCNIINYHGNRYGLWLYGQTVGKLWGVNIFGVRSHLSGPTTHNIMASKVIDSTILGIDADGALYETLEASYCYRCVFQGRLKNPGRYAFACWDEMQECVVDITAIDTQSPHTMINAVFLDTANCINNNIFIRRASGYTGTLTAGNATALASCFWQTGFAAQFGNVMIGTTVGYDLPNAIDLGVGVPSREANAGKMWYQTSPSHALMIIGGGTTTPRTILLVDQCATGKLLFDTTYQDVYIFRGLDGTICVHGTVSFDTNIRVQGNILPYADLSGSIGTDMIRFNYIRGYSIRGNNIDSVGYVNAGGYLGGASLNIGGVEVISSGRVLASCSVDAGLITGGVTANVDVAKVGGGTRTLHFAHGLYTGYTDS
jgi:hypothetical protein